MLLPVLAGSSAAIALTRFLPSSSSLPHLLLRVLVVIVASTAVVFLADRAARRLLPLAALYRLSLVFPDHAPSRFRTALKAGSSRRMARLVEETRRNGLPSDAGEAAVRVVELINAIGDHDRRTRGHSERVRLYADLIGEELHLTKEERQKLQWAALLHDLGKLAVPAEILNKRGAPDPDEWQILRTHPAAGERLIVPLRPFLGSWADAIGGHHEWWNGTGYPRQLRGDDISQSAAIVAVADAYEVMTAVRSYKTPMAASAARAELAHGAGKQFSPPVVRAFLSVSLGKLRWAAGPAASLAQIPYLGSAVRFPATVSTALQGAGSVASAAAPTVATLMVATTAVATSMAAIPAQQHAQKATTYAFARSTPGATRSGAINSTSGGSQNHNSSTGRTDTGADSGGGASAGGTTSTTVGRFAAGGPDGADPNSPSGSDNSAGPGANPTTDDTRAPTTNTTVPGEVVTDPVLVSIGDVSSPEGDIDPRTMSFPVTLSRPMDSTVSMHYAVTGISATAAVKPEPGIDLRLVSGTVTFAPGTSGITPVVKRIGVTIRGDVAVEPDETFAVTLSDPSPNAKLVRDVATGTILNDDGVVSGTTVGVGDASIVPVPGRTLSLPIPVRLSVPAVDPVSVTYTIDDGSAAWSLHAADGGDYGCVATSGVLDFEAGAISKTIALKLWPAVAGRPTRTFTVSLTAVDGTVTLLRTVGTITIYAS
jgi:hypothetical protein